MGNGKTKSSNTPYDDVFRTLLNDCSSLIIPVINEVFGEDYRGMKKYSFIPMNTLSGTGYQYKRKNNGFLFSGNWNKKEEVPFGMSEHHGQ